MIPLVRRAPERFRALRSFLEDGGFTERDLFSRLNVANLGELKSPGISRDFEKLDTPSSVLTHLFLDREPAPAKLVEERLGVEGAALLQEFGLLRAAPSDPGALLGTVMLYPLYGLYIASDRDWEPETGRGNLPRTDAVYLAITPNAYDYLSALPVSPCDDFLDLCSGAGISALMAARGYAKRACGCDLLERCAKFAAWSAELNGISNVELLTGDLYEPVTGRLFDRIVAHPPYVPSGETTHVFRDGGLDGERVTRGIIEGVPGALRPGGHCYLTAAFAERRDISIEARVRAMLGEQESDFDVFAVARRRIELDSFYRAEAAVRRAFDAGIHSFALCSIALQRRSSPRPVFTILRKCSTVRGPMLEWTLRWEAMVREPGFDGRLMRERLTAAPGVRLRKTHALEKKRWVQTSATLVTGDPFPLEEGCPPWVSMLLELCDGNATVRDALETLKARGAVPSHASGPEFARMVQMLISAGFLEIASLRLPASNG
ncbi:MAG TPA: methyltransferase [Bryobacteraceae bacterium]|nr:methyltransferase [Bryobacteraceae bacterium]